MADLTVSARMGPGITGDDETLAQTGGATLATGTLVRINTTTGRLEAASAALAGTADVVGIVYGATVDGNPSTLFMRGLFDGYDVSGMAYGDPIYLSDTDGAAADAAGTVSVVVGKVILFQGEKAAYFDINLVGA